MRWSIRPSALLVLHGAVVVVLILLGVAVALNVAGPTVGRDELYRLRPALPLAVAGAALPFVIAAVLTLMAAPGASRRARAIPVVGIAASMVLWSVALLFVHAPEPLQGG
ncbi:hypothetical protein [Leifsonia shinshuensis]|uniref:Type VI protein secretion system component VasK n=1 Tax=Leifsonia shinshuensis TaxID=150026 RepID=A0A853CTX6_9MICO|nr:hypothetical protein [Leifsonia shinshuensis]NYJ23852.1 type VI protein secretion system component VasK [Leifsonia shinshuensis]